MPDTKVSALDAIVSPVSTDVLYAVDDPAGTPASKKITIGDLIGVGIVNDTTPQLGGNLDVNGNSIGNGGSTISLTDSISIGSTDVILNRDAANTLALRNGTNAQELRVYNTYDGAGNDEFLVFKWVTNVAKLSSDDGDVNRAMYISGDTIQLQDRGSVKLYIDNPVKVYADFVPNSAGSRSLGRTSAGWGLFYLGEQSSDPAQPADGEAIMWMSDGTGLGDDGDVIIGANAGGTITYTILHDHSTGTTWS